MGADDPAASSPCLAGVLHGVSRGDYDDESIDDDRSMRPGQQSADSRSCGRFYPTIRAYPEAGDQGVSSNMRTFRMAIVQARKHGELLKTLSYRRPEWGLHREPVSNFW